MTQQATEQPTQDDAPIRLALIFGGAVSEHAVSCLGAAAVAGALDRQRYLVIGIGIATDGRWYRIDADRVAGMQIVDERLPELSPEGSEVVLRASAAGPVVADIDGANEEPIDVALIVMHGPGGEDGAIQGTCETVGLRHVGAGVAASAVGMDKHLLKLLLRACGLPVGPFVAITPAEWDNDPAATLDAVAALRFPVFVKPARAGSSRGISRVTDLDQVAPAIDEARRWDPKVIVEEGFVDARELECGVIQGADGQARVSVVGEVIMHGNDGFYDYGAKYTPGDEVTIEVPAKIDDSVGQRLREQAVRVFEVLGCEGLARVDSFLTREGKVMINEINTLPGMTPTSMFPKVWEASGLKFSEQLDTMIGQALHRGVGPR